MKEEVIIKLFELLKLDLKLEIIQSKQTNNSCSGSRLSSEVYKRKEYGFRND